jgi:hypothetical protein
MEAGNRIIAVIRCSTGDGVDVLDLVIYGSQSLVPVALCVCEEVVRVEFV